MLRSILGILSVFWYCEYQRTNCWQYLQYPQYRTPTFLKHREYPQKRTPKHCESESTRSTEPRNTAEYSQYPQYIHPKNCERTKYLQYFLSKILYSQVLGASVEPSFQESRRRPKAWGKPRRKALYQQNSSIYGSNTKPEDLSSEKTEVCDT